MRSDQMNEQLVFVLFIAKYQIIKGGVSAPNTKVQRQTKTSTKFLSYLQIKYDNCSMLQTKITAFSVILLALPIWKLNTSCFQWQLPVFRDHFCTFLTRSFQSYKLIEGVQKEQNLHRSRLIKHLIWYNSTTDQFDTTSMTLYYLKLLIKPIKPSSDST